MPLEPHAVEEQEDKTAIMNGATAPDAVRSVHRKMHCSRDRQLGFAVHLQ